jgi:hypothetical protein
METQISSTFYYKSTKDEIGVTINTAVFQVENGVFHAYSCYDQNEDEKMIGFGESENDNKAIKLSKQDLKRDYRQSENFENEFCSLNINCLD